MQITRAVSVSRDGSRRFYSRQLRTLHFAFVPFVTVVLTAGAASEFAAGNVSDFRWASRCLVGVGCLIGWRVLARGLSVDPDRVVIRNMLRTRTIRTQEIESFGETAMYGRALFRTGMPVVLRCGHVRYANVFSATPLDTDTGSAEAQELNEWLRDVRGGVRFPPGSLRPFGSRDGLWWAWLTVLLLFTGVCLLILGDTLLHPSEYASFTGTRESSAGSGPRNGAYLWRWCHQADSRFAASCAPTTWVSPMLVFTSHARYAARLASSSPVRNFLSTGVTSRSYSPGGPESSASS